MVYFVLGASRSLDFKEENGTSVSLCCDDGDMIAVEGESACVMPFDVGCLPVDEPNARTGVLAVTYVLRFQWSHDHVCGDGGHSISFDNLAPFPERIPAWVHYGVLGLDVEAKTSGVDGAGLGLFLLKDYPAGGPVTEYDGSLRSHSKIIGKRDDNILDAQTSHWRSLPGCDFVIEGISEHKGLFNGRGGASLANHKPGSEANCKFEIVWTEREKVPRFCEDDGCFHLVPRIILTLLRPANKGVELFVDYGDDTAKRFMEAHRGRSSMCTLGSKVGESKLEVLQFYDNSQAVRTVPEQIDSLPIIHLGQSNSSVSDLSQAQSVSIFFDFYFTHHHRFV